MKIGYKILSMIVSVIIVVALIIGVTTLSHARKP
jgi:hypothetical protein